MGCNVQCWCISPPDELNKSGVVVKERRVESGVDRSLRMQESEANSLCLKVPEKRGSKQKLDISTANSLQVPFSESTDDFYIMYEGPVVKYKPGISRQWIDRWCQVTSKHFLCFRSLESALLKEKPVAKVNLQDIDRIEQVDENIFEIFVRNEDPMIQVSRETQHESIDKSLLYRTFTHNHKKSVEPGKLMKKPLRGFENNLNKASQKNSWSFREIEWFASEKRLLFSSEDSYTWIMLIENYK